MKKGTGQEDVIEIMTLGINGKIVEHWEKSNNVCTKIISQMAELKLNETSGNQRNFVP